VTKPKYAHRVVRVEYTTTYYDGDPGTQKKDPAPKKAREQAAQTALEHLEAIGMLMKLTTPPSLIEETDADAMARAVRGLGALIYELTQNVARLTDTEGGEP
jgi:hypothetical protein